MTEAPTSANNVDHSFMSNRLKYPQEFASIINFATLDNDLIPETGEQRRARLRRCSNARRAAAYANSYVIRSARVEAVSLAWKQVYDGTSLPICFDLILSSGPYTRTERYTLVQAALSHRVFDHDTFVGSMGASVIRASRPKQIAPHVTHAVRVS